MRATRFFAIVFTLSSAAAVAALGYDVHMTRQGRLKLDQIGAQLGEGKLEHGLLEFDLLHRAYRLRDIRLATDQGTMTIEEIIIHDFADSPSGVPTSLHVIGSGVRSDNGAIAELGYGDLPCHFEVDYDLDLGTRELNLDRLMVGADGVFELEMALHVGGIPNPADSVSTDMPPEAMLGSALASLSKLELRSAHVRYEGQSLLRRALAMATAESGDPSVEPMDALIAGLEEMKANASPVERYHYSQALTFLRDGGAIEVSIEPEVPLSFQRLMSGGDSSVLELLDPVVRTHPPASAPSPLRS